MAKKPKTLPVHKRSALEWREFFEKINRDIQTIATINNEEADHEG